MSVPSPETVVYAERPPAPGQLIPTTIYFVAEALNHSRQEADFLADSPDGQWRQNNALITLHDGTRYYAHAPERMRYQPRHEGVVIYADDSLKLGKLLFEWVAEPLPVRVGAIWDCLENLSPVREVIVRRPQDARVFSQAQAEKSDEELAIRALSRHEGFSRLDDDLQVVFKKPAYGLAVSLMREHIDGPQNRRKIST